MEQEDLRAMTESECLEGCDAHDELDSLNGSDDAVLFERSHEKTGSRYEGKRLPRVKSTETTSLLIPRVCGRGTWSKRFSSKSPIQGGATLECVTMEER
ncbi:unnamed protein product [Boreogadus saida]